MKVPPRQPKRGRSWLDDGSCVRPRPKRPDHVRACDFVEDRTRDGRKFRMLCVVDGFTREALAIRVARQPGAADVVDVLSVLRGVPAHVRSDRGPESVAEAVKELDRGRGRGDRLHREGEPLGERMRGKLQRQAARRAAQGRGVQLAPRSAGADRAMAPAPQHGAPAQRVGLPAARAGGAMYY